MTWPKGWRPQPIGSRTQLIDVVEFNWYMTRPDPDSAVPRQLLRLLRELCPAALPRRYGDVEPFQHRFEGDVADAMFIEFWRAQSRDPLGIFFWTTLRPCLGVTVSMTPPAEREGVHPRTCVSLSFDSRPFFRDPGFADRMVRLFTELASTLDCVYAAGTLNRGFVLHSNAAWSAEHIPVVG